MKPSFHALIHFPHEAFGAITTDLDGLGIVNSMSREMDYYSADISFSDVVTAIKLFSDHNATLVSLDSSEKVTTSSTSAPAPKKIDVTKYQPRGNRRRVIHRLKRGKGSNTKANQLRSYLAGATWRTMPEIVKAVSQQESSVQARFTAFRKEGILEQKERDGRQVYRVKKAKG